ncbi:hypothetical protein [Acinetobacter baumannii]|uniref:hypothetical protein n=1 Tax=Acinetobacter baumannii TaxID=470 RepID=UPI0009419BC7|nr:hypothetical protein [Acinetobacter baumannii]
MNFLDTLLKVELKTVSSNPTFTILTSVIFSILETFEHYEEYEEIDLTDQKMISWFDYHIKARIYTYLKNRETRKINNDYIKKSKK